MFRIEFLYQYENCNECESAEIEVRRESRSAAKIAFWHRFDEILAELGISASQLSFIALLDVTPVDRA